MPASIRVRRILRLRRERPGRQSYPARRFAK